MGVQGIGMSIETGYADIAIDDFKAGMRQLAASVTVITAAHDGSKDGLTATATCSVSADPPQLLICVNQLASAYGLIRDAGSFGVKTFWPESKKILPSGSPAWTTPERGDRFGLGTWTRIATGALY